MGFRSRFARMSVGAEVLPTGVVGYGVGKKEGVVVI